MRTVNYLLIQKDGIILDERGQLTMELIFLIGVLLVVIVGSSSYILHQNELIVAMSAAREGVNEGISSDSSSVFPEDVYRDYDSFKKSLLTPNSIKLVRINYTNKGFDSKYEKEKIQFNVAVFSDTIKDKKDQDSAGDRINYNLRKSIAKSVGSENSTNALFNPVFSKNYIYTTANVKWL